MSSSAGRQAALGSRPRTGWAYGALLFVSLAGVEAWTMTAQSVASLRAAHVFVASDGSLSARAGGLLATGSPQGLDEALLLMAASGEGAIDSAVETIGDSALREPRIGVRVERQAERWATLGATESSLAAFELVRRVERRFPEPLVRMGEFCYSGGAIGGSCTEAFERAVATPADHPRDRAFKAMAHLRLCQQALGRDELEAAEQHCRGAIRLDTYGVYTTWHTPAAYALLGVALAAQERHTEATEWLARARRVAPSVDYVATAWFYLGKHVHEAQAEWREALTAYRTVLALAESTSSHARARERIAAICAAQPEMGCRNQSAVP